MYDVFDSRSYVSARRSRRELVENFLLVRLQFCDIGTHLLLSGRELGRELVNPLAYRCETKRKLLHVGWSGAGRHDRIRRAWRNRCGLRCQPAKLRR